MGAVSIRGARSDECGRTDCGGDREDGKAIETESRREFLGNKVTMQGGNSLKAPPLDADIIHWKIRILLERKMWRDRGVDLE